jgi:hypothetical protein
VRRLCYCSCILVCLLCCDRFSILYRYRSMGHFIRVFDVINVNSYNDNYAPPKLKCFMTSPAIAIGRVMIFTHVQLILYLS